MGSDPIKILHILKNWMRMCTKIKVITYGQQILHAASVGHLVFLSMRNSCQLVVAAIAAGTMNWRGVIDVANWWM